MPQKESKLFHLLPSLFNLQQSLLLLCSQAIRQWSYDPNGGCDLMLQSEHDSVGNNAAIFVSLMILHCSRILTMVVKYQCCPHLSLPFWWLQQSGVGWGWSFRGSFMLCTTVPQCAANASSNRDVAFNGGVLCFSSFHWAECSFTALSEITRTRNQRVITETDNVHESSIFVSQGCRCDETEFGTHIVLLSVVLSSRYSFLPLSQLTEFF